MRARVLRLCVGRWARVPRASTSCVRLAAAALQRSQTRGWRLAGIPGGCASRPSTPSISGSRASSRSRPTPSVSSCSAPVPRSSTGSLRARRCSPRKRIRSSPRTWSCCSSGWTTGGDMSRACWRRCCTGALTGCATCGWTSPTSSVSASKSSLAQIVDDRLSRACRSLGAGFCAEAACLPGVGHARPLRRSCLQSWKASGAACAH